MKVYHFSSILIIVIIIFSTGCATKQPNMNQITLIPQERLYDKSLYSKTTERNIPVKLTRDAGVRASLATIFLKINGEYVVWLNKSEQITIYLSEGTYVFNLVHSLFPYDHNFGKPVTFFIKSSMHNNFRIKAEMSSGMIITRSPR
ncbi:MAG: hypothetical protein ACQETL_19970 [Bacteroidota bacterium]